MRFFLLGHLFQPQIFTSYEISDNKAKALNLGETAATKLTKDMKHTSCLIGQVNYYTPFRLAKNLHANGRRFVFCGDSKSTKKGCSTNAES